MATFIRVRHKENGDIASIPEGALIHFPDWEPAEGPVPDKGKPKRRLSQPTDAVPAASTEQE